MQNTDPHCTFFCTQTLQKQNISSKLLVQNLLPVVPHTHTHKNMTILLIVTGSVFVCLYRRISLTANPIRFSFTVKLLIGSGQVYTHLRKVTITLLREIALKSIFYERGSKTYLQNPCTPLH